MGTKVSHLTVITSLPCIYQAWAVPNFCSDLTISLRGLTQLSQRRVPYIGIAYSPSLMRISCTMYNCVHTRGIALVCVDEALKKKFYSAGQPSPFSCFCQCTWHRVRPPGEEVWFPSFRAACVGSAASTQVGMLFCVNEAEEPVEASWICPLPG